MKKIIVLTVLIAMTIFACKKQNEETPLFTKAKIDGLSQKGPFINGSSLTLFELTDSFSQTGKSFNTQILDNLGTFEIKNIEIQTSYAKLKADGYYFNEVKNANSSSTITLYAISDLTNKSTANINLLSTLEVARIEYLLAQGKSFRDAKQQAQREVLNIFSINKSGIPESELLDISKEGDNNAILLAVSLIIQGFRTEAELSQLLGDISTDIRTDGILNSSTLGSLLISDAQLLSLSTIRSNIEKKYSSFGVTAIIPNFEKYVSQFINTTNYIPNKRIEYPAIINSKLNILRDTTFQVNYGPYYLGAYLPIGTSLKVVVKSTPGFNAILYGWDTSQSTGCTFKNYYPDSAVVSAEGDNKIMYIPIYFGPPSSLDFIIYEKNASTPTRIKTIAY